MDQKTSSPSVAVSSHRLRNKILFIFLIILLMGATFYATFYWQHKNSTKLFGKLSTSSIKVNYLKAQQVGLNDQITKLINENNSLNSKLATAESNQSSSTSSSAQTAPSETTITNSPTITVIGVERYTNPSNAYEYIEADVKVVNDGSSVLTVPISGFKIFDSAQDEGADFGDLAGTTLPDGYTVLTDLTLNPGQSISGALLLSTIYPNYSLFTLQYGTQDYPLNVN